MTKEQVRALMELSSVAAIVRFYGAFETSSSFWLVFDRLEGVDLFVYMEQNDFQPLEEDIVREIFHILAKSFAAVSIRHDQSPRNDRDVWLGSDELTCA